MGRKFKTKVCEFGRECTCCLAFKTRDKYAYGKGTTGRQSICKECYNKKMKEGFVPIDPKKCWVIGPRRRQKF